jgi:N-acetylglucosamine-6-phosphate deacetylase
MNDTSTAPRELVIRNAKIVLPDRIIDAAVHLRGGRIAAVATDVAASAAQSLDAAGQYLVPGFVDMHVHGGGGADFMDCNAAAFETALAAHLRHGTTSIVPTNTVARHDQVLAFLDLARDFKRRTAFPGSNLPRVVGSHLYGPYFAEEKVGCHPHLTRSPTQNEFREYLAHADHLLVATCAPELPGAADFYRAATQARVRLNAGHSNATWTEMQAAFDLGVRHVDHFFCAMSNYVSTRSRVGTPMQGGMMEFVLASDVMTTELIADGRHLSPELLRFPLRMLGVERVALVTDCSRALDMPPGEYLFGPTDGGEPFINDGSVGLAGDGASLASSVRGMDFMVRHMVQTAGVPLQTAIRMATLTPAKVLGLDREIGSIEVGKRADLLLLDDSLQIRRIIVGGAVHAHRQR